MRIAHAVTLTILAVALGAFPGAVFAQAQFDGFYVTTVEEENIPSGLGIIFAKQAGNAFTAVVSMLDQTITGDDEAGEGDEAEKGAWALIIGTTDPDTGAGAGTLLASSGLMLMGTVTLQVGPDGERGSFTTDFGATGRFHRIFP